MDKLDKLLHILNLEKLKEGDPVFLNPSYLHSFENYCEDVNDVPAHNHGKIIKVEENRSAGDIRQRYIYTVELPNGDKLRLFKNSLVLMF